MYNSLLSCGTKVHLIHSVQKKIRKEKMEELDRIQICSLQSSYKEGMKDVTEDILLSKEGNRLWKIMWGKMLSRRVLLTKTQGEL